MEALVNLLPKSWQPKAKAIATLVGAVAVSVVVIVPMLPKVSVLPIAALMTFVTYRTPAVGYVGPEPTP
jgi:hypothetical protein